VIRISIVKALYEARIVRFHSVTGGLAIRVLTGDKQITHIFGVLRPLIDVAIPTSE
jgi:hypothetical protein